MVSSSQTLNYHWVKTLYERHPVLAAFRKRADGFAAMVAFLHEVFEKRRQSRYVEPDLVHQLTDFWLATDLLNENAKAPREYLEEWTRDGMLRRFYDDLLHDDP